MSLLGWIYPFRGRQEKGLSEADSFSHHSFIHAMKILLEVEESELLSYIHIVLWPKKNTGSKLEERKMKGLRA